MLYYSCSIWCSDNTDAINRMKIQYGTSYVYPARCIGAHITAIPNHITGMKHILSILFTVNYSNNVINIWMKYYTVLYRKLNPIKNKRFVSNVWYYGCSKRPNYENY